MSSAGPGDDPAEPIPSLVACCAAITPMPSSLAPYQVPGPVTDAIRGHLTAS